MRFRSLFAKVFLWFWLANTLVISALALVVWLYPLTAPHRVSLEQLHGMQLRGALAVRDSKGEEAFEKHIESLEHASGLRNYWLDEQGHELRGETVPESLLAFAREAHPNQSDQRSPRHPPHTMFFSLTDAEGRHYQVISEFIGPGPSPYLQRLVSSRTFALRVLAAVLTAGLGCYALARYLASPVRRLQLVTRQLASGDLAARVDRRISARRDEIGDLGRDFDRMARQVESLLVNQRRLLQDVSHELRSPLARLNVALELAGRDATPIAATALLRARREADRLNELIGQLLGLARMDSGQTQSPSTSVDIGGLLKEVVADAEFEASSQNRHVRLTECGAYRVLGAPELLRWAFENVVRNAIHYTASGTAVEVSLRMEPNERMTCIEVRDHGPGVPEEALGNIFRPFFRVSEARDRGTGGVGLGLAISERAIELHRGTIAAKNAEGGGLVVSIRIPCE